MTFNTPKSITGKDFPEYEELDLIMASELKRWHEKQTHFWKKMSKELRRTTDFSEGGKSLVWSMNIFDLQDFDLRWEQALLLTSDPPSDNVLEGLYVSK